MLVTAFHLFLWSEAASRPLIGGFDAVGVFGNGWVGVGMFFVISGYCMAGSTKKSFQHGITAMNYSYYFLKRLLRIAVPFYISIAFWFVMINNFGVAVKSTGFIDVISHLLFVHNFSEKTFFSISGVYWSLAVEMQFYVLLPIIFVLFKSTKIKIALLAFTFLLSVVVNLSTSNQIITWGIPSYLYLFVLGWLCSSYQFEISRFINKNGLLVVTLLTFCFLLLYKGDGFNNKIKIYEIITSTVFAALMTGMIDFYKTKRIPWLIGKVSFIGKCSFSIYLYNYIFWVFDRNDIGILKVLMIFAFVVLFGILMYWLVEKNTEKLRKSVIRSVGFKLGFQ